MYSECWVRVHLEKEKTQSEIDKLSMVFSRYESFFRKKKYGFKQQSRTASREEIIARNGTHMHDTIIWIFIVSFPFPTF
jgi:hypothetical protein